MTVRWASDVCRFAEKTGGPLLDVFIRIWLGGIFWASGMVKLQSWPTALYLSAHEYPVSWILLIDELAETSGKSSPRVRNSWCRQR